MKFALGRAIGLSTLTISAALLAFGQPAPFSSTLQVKAACEAPGNTITLNQPVKVFAGAPVTSPQVVNSGCRIVLGPNAKMEIDSVGLRFLGPLVVESTQKGEFLLKKALVQASSASFAFAQETKIGFDESLLATTSGDLLLRLGDVSELVVTKPLAGRRIALQAAGSMLIGGGQKFAVDLSETQLLAGEGISFSSMGDEGSLSATNTTLTARAAGVTISSPGAKSQLDFASSRISAGNGISISYAGREAQVSLDKATLNAGIGGVTIAAGDNAGELGVVKLVDSVVNGQGGVEVRASVNALKGETVVEISRINAGGPVNVETGLNGVTSVKLNRLTSPVLVRAVTGASGACIAEGNTVRSASNQVCR